MVTKDEKSELSPLRLVGGKFKRGNVEVAPEIGNPEQIALLQKAERKANEREQEAKAGELLVDVYVKDIRYEVVCEFDCICGEELRECNTNYTDDWEELEDPECDDGTIVICPNCKRRYEINDNQAKLL
ncbi:MAG: hypothetical protein NC226_09715 [Bacteroides cellulosilyticus]|nr:hypothetical protein [Bacteroides cellulosilyticus]